MAGNSLFSHNVPGNNYALDKDFLKYDNNKKEYVQGGQNPPTVNSALSYMPGQTNPQDPFSKESNALQKFLKVFPSLAALAPDKLKNVLHSYFARSNVPAIDDTDDYTFGMQSKKTVLTESISSLLLHQHYIDCFNKHILTLRRKKQIDPVAQTTASAARPQPVGPGGLEAIVDQDVFDILKQIENTFAGTTDEEKYPILTTIMDTAMHILWLTILSLRRREKRTALTFEEIRQCTRVIDAICGGNGTGTEYLNNLEATPAAAYIATEVDKRLVAFQSYIAMHNIESSLTPYQLAPAGGRGGTCNLFPEYSLRQPEGLIWSLCVPGGTGPNNGDYLDALWQTRYGNPDPRERKLLNDNYFLTCIKPILGNIITGNLATLCGIASIISSQADDPSTSNVPKYDISVSGLDVPNFQDPNVVRNNFNPEAIDFMIPNNLGKITLSGHLGFNKYLNMLINPQSDSSASVVASLGDYGKFDKPKSVSMESKDNNYNIFRRTVNHNVLIGGDGSKYPRKPRNDEDRFLGMDNISSKTLVGGNNNTEFADWIRTTGPNVLLCAQFLWNADVRGDILSDGRFKFKPFNLWEDAKGKEYGKYFILLVKFYYNYVAKNTQIYKNGTMYHDLIGTVYADTALVPTRGQVIGNSSSMNILGGINVQIPQVYSFLQGTLPFMQTVAVILNQNNVRLNNSSRSSSSTQPTYSGSRAPPVLRGGGDNDNYKIIVASVLGEDFKEYSNMIGGALFVDIEPSKFNGKHLVEKLGKEAKLRLDQLNMKGIKVNGNEIAQIDARLNMLTDTLEEFEKILTALKAAVVDKELDKNKVLSIKEYTDNYMQKAEDIKEQYRDAVVLVGNIGVGGFP